MKNFQWTLCADIDDTSDSTSTSEASAPTTGTGCFCSTYPVRDGAQWPCGVKEQTDTGSWLISCRLIAMIHSSTVNITMSNKLT